MVKRYPRLCCNSNKNEPLSLSFGIFAGRAGSYIYLPYEQGKPEYADYLQGSVDSEV